MRIVVKQSGGYAGFEQELAQVDTAQLDAARAREIERGLSALKQLPAQRAVGADLLQYEITVEDGNRREVFNWTDDGSASGVSLRAFVNQLVQAAT